MIDEAEVREDIREAGEPPVDPGSLLGVLGLAIDAVDAAPTSATRDGWRELERAQRERTTVVGRLLLTLEPGAFLALGDGVYGFAPRVELPAWVPRQPSPRCVGRELACTLLALDVEAGVALLSPRLLSLRRAREAIGAGEQIQGTVVAVTSTGVVVDLGGARGFAPLAELSSEALLDPPDPAAPWTGYVTAMADTGPLLSQHAPQVRQARAQAAKRMLATLAPGSLTFGRLLRASTSGGLVSLEGGIAWGHVPRAGLHCPAGRRLARGVSGPYLVLENGGATTAPLLLWPAPRR
jgi:S1 RNA binding domain